MTALPIFSPLLAILLLLSGSPCFALIVEDLAGTTVEPADDPGWNYVSTSGRNLVYLGDSWILSAFHVGVPTPAESVVINGITFNVIANQAFVVRNQAGQGLSNDTDLRLMRINGDPELPPLAIASQPFSESTTPDGPQRDVMVIGNGLTQFPAKSSWNVEVQSGDDNDVWTEIPAGTGEYLGFRANLSAGLTKRWGTNRIADEDAIVDTNDDDLREQLQLTLGVGERDVVSLVTRFDAPSEDGLANEVQAVPNDSGSAVFTKASGRWELLGIVNSNLLYENQPDITAMYGNYTTFADLTYYRPDILRIMAEHPDYSLVGDLNLDGTLQGKVAGGTATEDLAAFVSGWGYNNGTGVGTVTSWKQGDLNRDGKTNYLDFQLLRSAFSAQGVVPTAEDLLGSANIPEPSSLGIALTAFASLAVRLRRPSN